MLPISVFLYYSHRILLSKPRQVQEVRVLVELVEDGAGRIFQVVCGEDGGRVWGQFFGEGGAALVVLECRDTGGDYRMLVEGKTVLGRSSPSPALSRCGCVSWSGWPNRSSAAGTAAAAYALVPPTLGCTRPTRLAASHRYGTRAAGRSHLRAKVMVVGGEVGSGESSFGGRGIGFPAWWALGRWWGSLTYLAGATTAAASPLPANTSRPPFLPVGQTTHT